MNILLSCFNFKMSLYIFLNEDQNCIDIPVFKGTNENGTEIAFKALIIL